MASFEDAAAGWEIFRGRSGRVTKSQLNAALGAVGRESISDRTFGHYQKLQRLGYTEYVSINRLDVRHANDSAFDIADRSRYIDRTLTSPGRLLIPRARNILSLGGTIGRVSEGFATLRVDSDDTVKTAARSSRYNKGVLVFDQVGIERAVHITDAVPVGSQLDLLLEFRSLLETELVLGESAFELNAGRIVLNLGADASLFKVIDVMHTTFDLLESVRGMVDLLVLPASGVALPTPTPRVRRLEVANPLELLIVGASTVFVGVTVLVKRVLDIVASGQSIAHASKAEQREQELQPLRVRALELENLKKSIDIAPLVRELSARSSPDDGIDLEIPAGGDLARLLALKDQAIEAIVELQSLSAAPIELTSSSLASEIDSQAE